jgi:hypothetical protein
LSWASAALVPASVAAAARARAIGRYICMVWLVMRELVVVNPVLSGPFDDGLMDVDINMNENGSQ